MGDFNNDGWQDLLFLAGGGGPDALYLNNGDGTFSDHAREAGLAAAHRGIGAAVGDYDGDGWLDLFVTSLGEAGAPAVPGRHRLYRNNGIGGVTERGVGVPAFAEVAESAGVAYSSVAMADGMGAAVGDYDLDGDLDLFVTGYLPGSFGNVLYRNNGDGRFALVTGGSGVETDVMGFGATFADMDGDRYPELLLVADFGMSRYFRNNGNGTFSDLTPVSGTGLDANGMGSAVGDLDNDGLLDWYVTTVQVDEPVRLVGSGNMLYLNRGRHRFGEAARDARVSDGGWGTSDGLVRHPGWCVLATYYPHRCQGRTEYLTVWSNIVEIQGHGRVDPRPLATPKRRDADEEVPGNLPRPGGGTGEDEGCHARADEGRDGTVDGMG